MHLKNLFICLLFLIIFKIGNAQCPENPLAIDPDEYEETMRRLYPGCPISGTGFSSNPTPLELLPVYVYPKDQTGPWWSYNTDWWYARPIPNVINMPTDPFKALRPCPGDIKKTPTIAPSSPTNFAGGQYGNTRKYKNGSIKHHDGIDIEAPVGTPLFSTHTGSITRVVRDLDDNHRAGSWGNLIEITFKIGEDQYKLLYAHLSEVAKEIEVGKSLTAGTYLGKSGISGNAGKKDGVYQDIIPHVHIKATKNGKSTDPGPVLGTKFDKSTGKPLNSPCQ